MCVRLLLDIRLTHTQCALLLVPGLRRATDKKTLNNSDWCEFDGQVCNTPPPSWFDRRFWKVLRAWAALRLLAAEGAGRASRPGATPLVWRRWRGSSLGVLSTTPPAVFVSPTPTPSAAGFVGWCLPRRPAALEPTRSAFAFDFWTRVSQVPTQKLISLRPSNFACACCPKVG